MNQFWEALFPPDRRRERTSNNHRRRPPDAAPGVSFSTRQQPQRQAPRPQQAPQKIPPASRQAIRQLPTIIVTPEDLVEESNRECCICLEPNELNSKVVRLPCSHIFHSDCIMDWLSRHCTCPVCRFELPTEDAMYERGRWERMQQYKPRYAKYELQRMSIFKLKQLCAELQISIKGEVDRAGIIAKMVESDKIDLIAAPQPVEYPLSLLQAMRVRELRQCMEHAGVFFNPMDVVEKQDMIQIFINSGRLELVPEEADEDEEGKHDPYQDYVGEDKKMPANLKPPPSSRKVIVETVTEESDDEQCSATETAAAGYPEETGFMEYNENFNQEATSAADSDAHNEEETEVALDKGSAFLDNNDTDIDQSQQQQQRSVESPQQELETVQSREEEEDAYVHDVHMEDVESPRGNGVNQTTTTTTTEPVFLFNNVTTSQDNSSIQHPPASAPMEPPMEQVMQRQDSRHAMASAPQEEAPQQFGECSIAELRDIGRALHVDLDDCTDNRNEMTRRLQVASNQQHSLDGLDVSSLRALARVLNIDVSQCTNRNDICLELQQHFNNSPPQVARHYLDLLIPLVSLSISELKALARQWNVNVSDCLEKQDMMERLLHYKMMNGSFVHSSVR